MEKLIVGARDCSVWEIADVIQNSPSFSKFESNSEDLFRKLEIPKARIEQMRMCLLVDKLTILRILEMILDQWREINPHSATLEVLMTAFKSIGMKEIADDLEERFRTRVVHGQKRITVTTKWQEIDDNTKEELLNKNVKFLGKFQTVSKIWSTFSDSPLDSFLIKYPDGITLSNIYDRNGFVLAEDTIPKQLEYYLERKLTKSSVTAHKLVKEQIFQHHAKDEKLKDVLVVQGKTWMQLICLARGSKSGADRSSSQVEKLTAKFILLEGEEDFELICKKAGDNRPVHLLRFQDRQYYLTKSHGSTANLQQFLEDHHQIEHLKEKDFLNSLPQDSTEPVCISDTAGMGKTRLLASIAHQMKRTYPDRIVVFISMMNFPWSYITQKLLDPKNKLKDEIFFWVIAVYVSESSLGWEMLFEFMRTGRNKVEIFLDEFDEIQNDDIKTAASLLPRIIKNFKNIRIFMTTRPHRRQEAENMLGVKAYNILPFQEQDQITFLTRYWNCKARTIVESDFHEFAKLSITKLKSNMVDAERDIAGIPLQCMLLADVCFERAIRYVKKGTHGCTDYGLTIPVNSISSMFQKHIEKRFVHDEIRGKRRKIYGSRATLDIKRLHVFHATKLLFPDWADRLEKVLVNPENRELGITDLFPFGIIEKSDQSLRFIHRTLAQYLLAEFLVDSIQTNEFDPTVVSNLIVFLFGTVFQTEECQETIPHSDLYKEAIEHLNTYKFKHPVMCYFVNAQVANYAEMTIPAIQTQISQVEILWLISACALDNTANLVTLTKKCYFLGKKIPKWELEETRTQQKSWSNLVTIAAKHNNRELLENICDILFQLLGKNLNQLEFSFPYTITPFHVAAHKGNMKTVAFLWEVLGDHHLKTLQLLLHVCVDKSAENPIGMVNTKTEIISLILNVDNKFLEEKTFDGRTPLLMDGIHVNLIKFLVGKGADITAVTDHGSTFLHKAARYVSPREFYELVGMVMGKPNEKMLLWCDGEGFTPIHRALSSPQGMDTAAVKSLLEWVKKFGKTEFIVGNPDCSFTKILKVLCRCSQLVANWTRLAIELDIPPIEITTLKQDMFLDKQNHVDVLMKILEKWRAEFSNAATLDKLVEALRACGSNSSADSLMEKFHRTDNKILDDAFKKASIKN